MNKMEFKKYDSVLISVIIILVLIGLFMVLSSSYIMAGIKRSNGFIFFIKQFLCLLIGSIACFITAFKIEYTFYQKWSRKLYALILAALILLFFLGSSRGGATRWFNLGLFTIQPSEFAKIIMIIMIADFISRRQKIIATPQAIIAPIVYYVPILILIAAESDLGTNILITFIIIAMLLCAGIKMNKVFFAIILCIASGVCVEILRKGYRTARLMSHFSSLFDLDSVLYGADKTLYQVKLSLYALGSGSLFFGKGPGNGELKLMYLPEAHTDFIYSIIGEEFGFIGALLIIVLFIVFFKRGIKISTGAPDIFSKFLALGITLLIVSQAMLNIGVALGILPTKGLVLPFISFGGTALIANMISAGILINLSQYSKR